MGVQGLWTVVQPCARPTNLATLNRKRLAVDASIWIYQFLKAVRDKEGNALRNSHIVGFFRRLCKLLWYGVKPVFVFDGGAPALKRATLQGRRRRREGRREDAARTAGKLLAVQMHRLAEEEEEKRQRRMAGADDDEQEELPSMENIVYADELGLSKQERQRNRKFHKQDAYHLPELQNGIEAMGKPDDPRIMSVEELEEYARQFNSGENINLYDFSKIDFDGEFFKTLPPADRYNILNAARLRSRLRMGLSKEQLDVMFPDRMAFSRFQIERVKERNYLTQRLMLEMGMTSTDMTVNASRVAGDRNREYILVKNEGAEGGWALGVVTRDKDKGKAHKPIDVDALDFQYQNPDDEDEWEDEEFEDVPIEGLNRLPKITSRAAYERAQNFGSARQQLYNSLQGDEGEEDDDEALFVNDGEVMAAEDEELNRAIALSLEQNHGVSKEKEDEDEDEEFEDVPAPKWTQRAAPEVSRPITSTSGTMIAHIVNNRANAAVKKPQEKDDSDSDSDGDLHTALAAARKKQPKPKPVQKSNVKNSFNGPLPFEKLDWRSAFGGSKPSAPAPKPTAAVETTEKPRQVETGDLEAESDEEAGGFIKEPSETAKAEKPVVSEKKEDDEPLPLPPWLTDNTDITEHVRRQQQIENQQNAEDEELAQFHQLQRRREQYVEIESSSDDDSDIEILDAPPESIVQTLLRARSPPGRPGASLPSLQDDLDKKTASNDAEQNPAAATTPPPAEEFESDESPMELDAVGKQPSETAPPASAPQESEDEDVEFEDVVVPSTGEPSAAPSAIAIDDTEAFLESGDEAPDLPPSEQSRIEGLASAINSDEIFTRDDSPEYDEFYDPEEEELLAQMAEEAEEHARFASQLNNKTQRENQEAYEQELRALRTQQKKDRRDADEVTQVMVTECQALLRLFGVPYITAPMEAEAQCAELVRLNLVDGIVTDDSDTFLFGGTRVYKNMFNSNKFVECYLLRDLEDELELSREQLIALAQLLGSDYTEGIPGIGPVTAVEILSEFPGREGLSDFKTWWEDVQSGKRPKEADASSPFRRKFRKGQATKLFLPLGFPSPAVFDAYLHPEVDSSQEQFQWGVPDLEGLRQFLMSTIGWSKERTDEVLVPVIRDVNRREAEGTQANITRYFEGGVGSGTQREAFAPRRVGRGGGGSKRMAEAVGRLKARRRAVGGGGLSMEMPVAIPAEKGKGKRKGRKRKAREAEIVEEEEVVGEEDEVAREDEEVDDDDDEDDDDDVVVVAGRSKGGKGEGKATAGRGRGRGRGKRSKA
ncbi:DNA repair protein rad2 [Podospora bellae-mahoneyi]|uniref:DNA repair protein rad2 n=1 Tax=Podospora bellae-mahoneyi TaxID=2093777 RepID=A0ABR0FWT4_9PEZI|nr:DNA repair protein rad2 [Podospora bellae-mahoneyi]